MFFHLTVYCTRAVDRVTATDLKAAIDEADMHTVEEVWGIEDETVVDEALSYHSIELISDPKVAGFRLRYAAATRR